MTTSRLSYDLRTHIGRQNLKSTLRWAFVYTPFSWLELRDAIRWDFRYCLIDTLRLPEETS